MADIDQLALRIAETDLVACQTCIIFDDRGSVLFTASKVGFPGCQCECKVSTHRSVPSSGKCL